MRVWVAAAVAGLAALAGVPALAADGCCAPTGADFPKVGGDYGNQNHSALRQITPADVGRLGAAWRLDLEGGSTAQFQQSTVVAVGGVLYAETTQGKVFAIDGKTGQVKWTYASPYGALLRRGVGVGAGKVFTAGAGRHVIALDQSTGKPVWDVQIADEPGAGTLKTAITYYDGLVYLGSTDGPRGLALALRAEDGSVAWRFHGAPGPGEPGYGAWAGDSWKTGGASPWMHPAIDPALGLIYWTFGNARAGTSGQGNGAVYGAERAGSNLYANSLVAFEAKTGKVAWSFQSVHHDIWDMDNVMAPVLADLTVGGRMVGAVIYGSKTGLVYVLDRATGKPVTPIDERPVPQEPLQKTWPTQPYPRGDALLPLCPAKEGPTEPPPHYKAGCLFTPHTTEPVIQAPGIGGGGDWSHLSFDPKTGLLYVGVGLINGAHSITDGGVGFRPLGEKRAGEIVAFDPAKHKVVWRIESVWSLAHGNGILTTDGGLMFIGQPDGQLVALDLKGRPLWRFQTGAGVHTSPIAYQVDGEDYVAVLAGGNGLPYNSPKGDHLWAFRLGGTTPPAPAPEPPPTRQPIFAAAVEGSNVANTVQLARAWTNGAPAAAESTTQNSMAPQALRVPVGTTVTFLNPAGNAGAHCATQFYEGLFDTGRLQPGQSFAYTFKAPGEYFYNDCASPRTTGKVVVY